MNTPKPKTITYKRRGWIERGAKYTWVEGYSADSAEGNPLYPWMTKKECRKDASSQGAFAVFTETT